MSKPTRRSVLLSAAAGTGLLGLPWWAHAGTPAKKLVYVLAAGGWDVTYAMDPKLGLDTVQGPEASPVSGETDDLEELAQFGDISICINNLHRPAVTEFFERWAQRCAVVNGIWVGALGHHSCALRVLTGRTSQGYPDVGAIAGWELGQDRPIPYMDIGGRAQPGDLSARSLRLGLRGQLHHLLEPTSVSATPGAAHDYPLFVPTASAGSAIEQWLDTRAQRFAELRGVGGANDQRLSDYFESTERARELRAGSMNLPSMQGPGSALGLESQVDAALTLLANGDCQSVALDGRMPSPGWDTHRDNVLQHANFELLFQAVNNLVAGLEDGGLLDDTVVVITSEMARSPGLNDNGRGKDHWHSTSALVLGGGTPGGRVYGGTNEHLQAEAVDLASGDLWEKGTRLGYDSFLAGLLRLLDIDSQRWLPGVEAFGGLDV